jgi:hypothetical protein
VLQVAFGSCSGFSSSFRVVWLAFVVLFGFGRSRSRDRRIRRGRPLPRRSAGIDA